MPEKTFSQEGEKVIRETEGIESEELKQKIQKTLNREIEAAREQRGFEVECKNKEGGILDKILTSPKARKVTAAVGGMLVMSTIMASVAAREARAAEVSSAPLRPKGRVVEMRPGVEQEIKNYDQEAKKILENWREDVEFAIGAGLVDEAGAKRAINSLKGLIEDVRSLWQKERPLERV